MRARILLLLLALPARADDPLRPLDTIEWLVATADVVVTATVEDFSLRKDASGYTEWELLDLRITRTFKWPGGTHPETHLTVVKPRRGRYKAESLAATGEEFLYLLHHGGRAVGYLDRLYLADKLYLPDPDALMIRLAQVIDPPILSSSFNILTTPADLLAAVRREVEIRPADADRPTLPRYVPPPLNSPIRDSLNLRRSFSSFRGTVPYYGPTLRVPDDGRWKPHYIAHVMNRQLSDLHPDQFLQIREEEFSPVGSRDAIEALKPYLHDPDFTLRHAPTWPGSILLVRQKFFHRRAFAAELLQSLNSPATVTVIEPAYDRRPFRPALLFLLAAPFLLALLVARRTTSLHRRVVRACLVTTLALTFAAAFLAHRSRHHYDEILFATRNAEFEISSCYGNFQFLRIAEKPGPYGPTLFTLSLQPTTDLPDHISRLVPATTYELGLQIITGVTPRPFPAGTAWFKPYHGAAYHLVRIPWWMLGTLFGLLPAIWALSTAYTALRRRHRRRKNLCPQCAYDLRATPGQCPECGWPNHPGAQPPPTEK